MFTPLIIFTVVCAVISGVITGLFWGPYWGALQRLSKLIATAAVCGMATLALTSFLNHESDIVCLFYLPWLIGAAGSGIYILAARCHSKGRDQS